MINKQKLWFLTLFSLILVLSVYYITMPTDLLNAKEVTNNSENDIIVNVVNEDSLSILRVMKEEERLEEINDLKVILNNSESTTEEKNNAYEKMKLIEETKSKESALENIIKEKFNLKAFIKINNNQIKVVIESTEHSYELANNIMKSIQEEYDEKVFISVKFQ